MAQRLALIAGSGQVVPLLIAALRRRGDDLVVIDIVGRDDLGGTTVERIPLAEARRLFDRLKLFRPRQMILAGGVDISEADRLGLQAAFGTKGRLVRSLGDLGLAGLIWLEARTLGIRLVGAHEVLPELVAPAGRIAGPEVSARDADLCRYALAVARTIGGTDLGQAVVVSGRRPVAAEDAGGTDALLSRVGQLRERGLVGDSTTRLILAKALKPRQPKFVDLPSIGPATIAAAEAAGIGIVAVEAGRSLLIEREALVAAADARGISVIGVRHG